MNARPLYNEGDPVPRCSTDECPEYDGKRCRLLGHRPGDLCEPVVAKKLIEYASLQALPPAEPGMNIVCLGCETKGPRVKKLHLREPLVDGGKPQNGHYVYAKLECPPEWFMVVSQEGVLAFCGQGCLFVFMAAWRDVSEKFSHPALGDELQIQAALKVFARYDKERKKT